MKQILQINGPVIPFCLDEGPDAHDGVHLEALDQLEELDQVQPAFEIVLRRMQRR